MTNCPKCNSETLVKTTDLGNIPLDACPGCKGIWFDKGELEALLKQSKGGAPAGLDLLSPKPGATTCPRCNVKMERGGLVNPLLLVDKCASCGGVWLDPRELALLKTQLGLTGGSDSVEVARQAPPPAPPASGLSLALKFGLGLAALAGFGLLSFELYLYFSPAGSVSHVFSAPKAVAGLVLLVVCGFSIRKVK